MISSWRESLQNSVPKLKDLSTIDYNTHIIVASDISTATRAKKYSILSREEYLQLLVDSKSESPSVYEMISGSSPHRIFIDLDGTVEKQLSRTQSITYLNPYLTAIAKIVRDHIKINRIDTDHIDIFVYTASHQSKLSFHIVVDVLMNTMRATRDIVKKIIEEYIKNRSRMVSDPVCDIDDKIYNRNRAFRSLYSRKIGNPIERSKIPFAAFRYPSGRGARITLEPSDIEFIEKSIIQPSAIPIRSPIIIERTVIKREDGTLRDSKYIKSAHVLYSIDKPIPQMATIRLRAEEDRITTENYVTENLDNIYRIYIEFAQRHNMNQMTLRDRNGSMISLNRTEPSYCICCDKNHDNDNAYLRVNTNPSTTIYYMCYRGGISVRIN